MFVAWRDLRFARGRFVLMGGVIVLITMLVGLLSGLTSGLGRESTSAITGLNADRLVFARSADGPSFGGSSVEQRQWLDWRTAPGVLDATPLGVAPGRATSTTGSLSVSVFGVEPGTTVDAAAHDVRPGEVVLSTGAAEELALVAGDAVSVGGEELRVAAVRGAASFSHTPVVWTSLGDWQRLAGRSTGVTPTATVVALRTGPSFDPATAPTPEVVVTIEDSLSAIGAYTSENGSLQLIRGFLFVISAVVIGAFFTVWTIQRSGDIAVLKALGASDRYLVRDAVGQALVLLLLGSTVGALLAAGAGALAAQTVPFVLDPATLGLPLLAMVALGLLGAVLSVRRITSVDPLVALGSTR